MKEALIKTLFAMTFIASAQAATLAIIDSGTDMKHQDIASYAWVNQKEIANNDRDEDRNGYPDDIHGWNFAEGNAEVIDYSYLGTLDDNIRKFFATQTKMFYGTATKEDIDWLKSMVKEEAFIKKLGIYGNFMHGTHVSGIAIKGVVDSKLLAVKLIPTEVKLPGQDLISSNFISIKGLKMKLAKFALGQLAKVQMNQMKEIAHYVDEHGADVANGSFGTGFNQAVMIVNVIYKALLKKDAPKEVAEELAHHFMVKLVEAGADFVAAAPKTLFVFAAGNDGMDNDEFPTSPTNVQADNVISVAATMGRSQIASFSNYGIVNVDVAAPGVAIRSSAPGDNYIEVSGTSQAAPYVANIATKVKEINPKLLPVDVKKIILATVDNKEWLKGKVLTSGIVNTERAQVAAFNSLTMDINEAISNSKISVNDIEEKIQGLVLRRQTVNVPVLSLPSPFQF